jgi:hypothetical protein
MSGNGAYCFLTSSTHRTANSVQDRNAWLFLRAEQFNFLRSVNKCYGLSLSLSGTAAARSRWHQALKDNGHDNILQRQLKIFTTMWHIYFFGSRPNPFKKNKRATLLTLFNKIF